LGSQIFSWLILAVAESNGKNRSGALRDMLGQCQQEALAHGPVAVNAQKEIARAAADPARVIELGRALKY